MPRKTSGKRSTTTRKGEKPAISKVHKIGKPEKDKYHAEAGHKKENLSGSQVEQESQGERAEVPAQQDDTNHSLEKGNIHFYYRPKVQKEEAHCLDEVQRLFVILSADQGQSRLLVVGKKKLPSITKHERFWGKVENVTNQLHELTEALHKETYSTATLGDRVLEAARPAGYGRYAVVMHKGHSFLAFALELPETLGEVQKAFQIPKEGSFVLKLKRDGDGQLRWVDVQEPSKELKKGVEVLLVGASNNLSAELKKPGEELKQEAEAEVHNMAAEEEEALPGHLHLDDHKLFEALQLERQQTTIEPLTTGEWK